MLDDYQRVWEQKPLLRRIYNDMYDRIAASCVRGTTVEIGGGIGQFKSRFPDVIATDIQKAPWLDLVTDAQNLPFAANSIANIVMVDVLHHVEFPLLFLREADRVLRRGGRLVMAEPAITWGSSLFYRLFHHEPVRINEDPLTVGKPDATRDPYNSNQAIPTLLVSREHRRLEDLLPSLRLIRTDWFSLWVYPLSGGFKSWSLLSDRTGNLILGLEKKLEPMLGRFLAFRLLIIMEKQ